MADQNVKKRIVHGSTLGAGLLLALALLLIVNYLGWKYHARFDWTKTNLYTLSEKSGGVLEGLDRPIRIYVFLTPGSELYEPLRELLAQYEAASQQITVRWLDPVRNLLEAQRLVEELELANDNVVVVASDTDKRVLLEADLEELDYSAMQFGGAPTVGSFKGEQEITGAILELAEDRKPKLVFTTGHGERKIDDLGPSGLSHARDLLATDNVEIEEWASLGQSAVPEGTDVLVVAGPTGSFTEPELEKFDLYLATGGRMLVMLDPTLSPTGELVTTGLETWLEGHGIEVGADVVLDPAGNLPFFSAETLFTSSYGSHATTRSLRQQELPTMVSLARSVGESATAADLDVQVLLYTSAEGWGERDLATGVERGEGDLAGPVPLAAVVEQEAEDGAGETEVAAAEPAAEESEEGAEPSGEIGGEEPAVSEPADEAGADTGQPLRLVVFGDSDFAANRLLQANVGNQVLLFDTVNWLVEREALLGIPAKETEKVRLNLTSRQVLWLWLLAVGMMPGAAIAAGIGIYWRRRR